MLLSILLFKTVVSGDLAFDLRHNYLPAAHAVIHGLSPFPHGNASIRQGSAYIYPPLVAYLTTPLLLLPTWLTALIATVVLPVICLGALWIFGVRDWRCYGCVLLWLPTFSAIQTANLSIPLLLALAIAWRMRGRAIAVGFVVAAAVAAKFFLWPMLVWLLATRRYRAAVSAAFCAFLLVFGPWAPLHFQGLSAYPGLLRAEDRFQAPHSYTVSALGERLGLGPSASVAAMLLIAALAIAVTVREGRRGHDSLSFAAAVTAALMASPIVWLHYFVLLAAVVAVRQQRLAIGWAIPVLLLPCPVTNGSLWQIALALSVPPALLFAVSRRTRVPSSTLAPVVPET